jgi:hypothetical protein
MEASHTQPDYEGFEPNRLKHLDQIQTVIGRLAGNSFVIKGWAITVAAAVFGFALNSSNTPLVLAAVIPTLAFWALDTYFLRSERLFRALYDEVRLNDHRITPFFMAATEPEFMTRVRKGDTAVDNRSAPSWIRCAKSVTLALVYGGLLIAACVVAAITHFDEADSSQLQRDRSHERFESSQALAQALRIRSAMPSSIDSLS